MTGRMLNERLGKVQFWLLFVGTNLTFFPQHLLGLDGMIRRIADYSPNAGWTELNFLSTIGAFIIAASVLPFLWNVFITLREPAERADDPWDAQHARMGHHQPAAAVQLRLAAADPLRAAALRPQARAAVTAPRPSRAPVRAPETAHDGTAPTRCAAPPGQDAEVIRSRRSGEGMDTALLGMLLFIASEVMFFAALFGAYFNARGRPRPVVAAGGLETFIDPVVVPVVATIILVISSFTMQWAHAGASARATGPA